MRIVYMTITAVLDEPEYPEASCSAVREALEQAVQESLTGLNFSVPLRHNQEGYRVHGIEVS